MARAEKRRLLLEQLTTEQRWLLEIRLEQLAQVERQLHPPMLVQLEELDRKQLPRPPVQPLPQQQTLPPEPTQTEELEPMEKPALVIARELGLLPPPS